MLVLDRILTASATFVSPSLYPSDVRCYAVARMAIRNSELRKRLRLETLDFYVELRKLRWAGHVARMGYERIPRKFLTSWVHNPRPIGRPQFTYGHSLNKTLENAGITTDFEGWSEMAQDRGAWRAQIHRAAQLLTFNPRTYVHRAVDFISTQAPTT